MKNGWVSDLVAHGFSLFWTRSSLFYIYKISFRFDHDTPLLITYLHLFLSTTSLSYSKPQMVKFSKELEAQLIPEWKEAFVNYWQLKKQIKRIKLSRLPNQSHHHAKPHFAPSIFNSFRFFLHNIAHSLSDSHHPDLTIIQVTQ